MALPESVLNPHSRLDDLNVIHSTGDDGWSVATMLWDGNPAVGIRWNGADGGIGNPQSRGTPTWFILPEELEGVVLAVARVIASVTGFMPRKAA